MDLCKDWTLGRLEKDHFVTMNHAGLVFEKETLSFYFRWEFIA